MSKENRCCMCNKEIEVGNVCLECGREQQEVVDLPERLTLRDQYAMAALPGFLGSDPDFKAAARAAFGIADAMIDERAKPRKKKTEKEAEGNEQDN